MTVFFRILDAPVEAKPAALLETIRNGGVRQFDVDHKAFSKVPGSPFAYWVSHAIRDLFSSHPMLDGSAGLVRVGVATGDDARFLRCWWEVADSERNCWRPLAKGGAFSRFYADLVLVIDWRREGEPIELSFIGARIRKPDFGRPGLTWPARTNGLSIRVMPAGAIFTHKGPAIFDVDDASERILALASVMNSSCFSYLVGVQLARTELAQSYEVGLVQQTPVPDFAKIELVTLATLAQRAWSYKRTLDTTNEISHAFVLPPGSLGYEAVAPNEHAGGFSRSDVGQEIETIQQAIDERAFAFYDISDVDRVAIESVTKGSSRSVDDDDDDDETQQEGEEDGQGNQAPGAPALPVYSWLVGVVFGRFDKRLATGKRPIPPEPDPFDSLPSRSPGMWPADEEDSDVPPVILVDDSGHDDDIRARVANAAANTGWPDPDDLRQWLAHDFFPLHIKMYSKSRRKAPIYWQLATPSASYSVWLYIHAFTKDALYKAQNEYVSTKLGFEERKLEELRRTPGETLDAAARRELAAQEAFVDELRGFLEEVKRVTPLWNPNLDDGVIINFAPLWRLVPQHKSWQKELKVTWDALCAGDYDWSHLAMHLWPERVVPQCATDRSLAIGHGLEEVFWSEGSDSKWKPRLTPTRPLAELISERSSPAVKAALRSLLEAPSPSGAAKRGRKTKSNA